MYKSFGQVNEYLPASRPFRGDSSSARFTAGVEQADRQFGALTLTAFRGRTSSAQLIEIWLIKYELGAGVRRFAPPADSLFRPRNMH
jgi:hypothetical protein